jgi:probable phosphoglycerate mutase
VRHGETVWNAEKRIQGGGSDVELSETGREQVESLGLSLKDTRIDAVYSSPLKRALTTAEAIVKYQGLQVRILPALKEMEVGELEGLSLVELGRNFSQHLVDWRDGKGASRLPGGESLVDLANRVWPAVQSIISQDKQGNVAIVSHYFVTVTIVCSALGLPLSHIQRIRVQPSSKTVLDFSGSNPVMVSLGDTCHLRED